MSINLTDEIEVKTKKGKLGAAKQIFLEGDMQTVEKEIQDINSRHNSLNTKHESLSRTVQGIAATGGASTANNVTYNNSSSGLNAENTQDAIDELQDSKVDKISILQELGNAKDKVMSQKAVSGKFSVLSNKIEYILGTERKILYDNIELSQNQILELPDDIYDNTLVQFSLLTEKTNITRLIFYAYYDDTHSETYSLTNNFPLSILYKQCKKIGVYLEGVSKINIKIELLANKGLFNKTDRLLYRGIYNYIIKIDDLNLKAGDKLLIKNVVTSNSNNPIQFYIYKEVYGVGSPILTIYPKNETILTVEEGVTKYYLTSPYGNYDSVAELYLVSSDNNLTNNLISQLLSEYDFIAAGDSITAWNGKTDTDIPGVEKFEGWANLLNAQIGFKTYKNIAVPGASYTQSSVYGSYVFSINKAIKDDLPEGFEGIFTMMGGTNDYNGKKSLGTAEETMAKTYEELDQKNSVSNFSTICDGFRYCLETAIKRCSWRARIFVMTCVPRNDKQDYFTVAEMNEQIKLISKAFNVPVLDLFSELNFRNGLDQFGETWKLSENPENVHPNAEAQKMMMRFVFGKLFTYIR